VIVVTDHQLQGVLARGQLEAGLGLAAAEVTMMIVGWNRLTGRRQLIGSISRWWWPVAALSTPAGATPMPLSPNCTVTGELTVAPSVGDMK